MIHESGHYTIERQPEKLTRELIAFIGSLDSERRYSFKMYTAIYDRSVRNEGAGINPKGFSLQRAVER